MSAELACLDQHDGGDYDRPTAWMQRDDGSWWVVDEFGIAWPVAAFGAADDLGADVDAVLDAIGQHAVIDVAPLTVTDIEATQ